jgi:hypothetical protein
VSSSLPPPLEETLLPLAEALEALGIRYVIGGSVASSLYGEPRHTADLDVVIELLDPQQLKALVQKVAPFYYLDEDAFIQDFHYKSIFRIISIKTYTKVDIFFLKPRALPLTAMPSPWFAIGPWSRGESVFSLLPRPRSSPCKSGSGMSWEGVVPPGSGMTFSESCGCRGLS